MSSRDIILQNIRRQEQGDSSLEQPPRPSIWDDPVLSLEERTQRFTAEIEALNGEVHLCTSMSEARKEFSSLVLDLTDGPIGMFDRGLCHQVSKGILQDRWILDQQFKDPQQVAGLPIALVAPDYLLADTGSVVVSCDTKVQRLLCYLPPVFLFVASARMIFEHMPAAWEDISRRSAEPERRGEFVIITGPSRTSDIEKKLILGVHGPKRVIGFIIRDDA